VKGLASGNAGQALDHSWGIGSGRGARPVPPRWCPPPWGRHPHLGRSNLVHRPFRLARWQTQP
jgi:hypothetical protein